MTPLQSLAFRPLPLGTLKPRGWLHETLLPLDIGMPVRAEKRDAGSVCLHRGPLLLALRLGEEWRDVSCPYTALEPRARNSQVSLKVPRRCASAFRWRVTSKFGGRGRHRTPPCRRSHQLPLV